MHKSELRFTYRGAGCLSRRQDPSGWLLGLPGAAGHHFGHQGRRPETAHPLGSRPGSISASKASIAPAVTPAGLAQHPDPRGSIARSVTASGGSFSAASNSSWASASTADSGLARSWPSARGSPLRSIGFGFIPRRKWNEGHGEDGHGGSPIQRRLTGTGRCGTITEGWLHRPPPIRKVITPTGTSSANIAPGPGVPARPPPRPGAGAGRGSRTAHDPRRAGSAGAG